MENPIWMLVPWAVFAVALGIKAPDQQESSARPGSTTAQPLK
jgi:hypothetical protein